MISEEVNRGRLALTKRLNDMHIFIYQAISLLSDYKNNYQSKSKSPKKFYVPSTKTKKFAYRSDKDLEKIYNQFIHRSLYENFIVMSVSIFEVFLFDVLKFILIRYPLKLGITIKGTESNKKVDLDIILKSKNQDDIISKIIVQRLNQVSYLAPLDYLQYFKIVTGIVIPKDVFNDYTEIKATRDLLIHNSGIVNKIYLQKVGKQKRGKESESIPIDSEYYDHCVATLKELAIYIDNKIKIKYE
jgi:hypothetical protein